MKILYDKYDKAKINDLPRAIFDGRIITVISESEADKAIDYLMSQPILGLDTETRPSFKRGQMHQVALLQVATHDTCFLFRLNRIGITDSIVRLLEDNTIPKIGLSLHDDFHTISRTRAIKPGYHIELQKEVRELGILDMSLQKIYANLFGEKIAKNQQLTNWEASALTDAQQRYAATDAWACIKIHEEVRRLAQTGEFELIVTPTDENNPT